MAVHRHVWTGFDATVNIYQESDVGAQILPAVLSYCFWQNASISATLQQKRRPVTGRSRLKIVNGMWTYTAQVATMYFRKSEELALVNIFSRQQPLQFELSLVDTNYSGSVPQENDNHLLKRVFANKFQITGKEDDILIASASFAAEEFDGDIT